MIASGYGFGAALTSAPLALMIRDSGYRHAFRFFGIFQGIAILAFAVLLVKPTTPQGAALARKRIYQGAELTPSETLRTGVFWLLYLIYLLIAFGGMIVTAQLGPIARDFGLESRTILILGMSTPVLALAVSIDNLANGVTRPLSGWLSDVIGREKHDVADFLSGGSGVARHDDIRAKSIWLHFVRRTDFSILGRDFRRLSSAQRRQFRHSVRGCE
jgi:OFA family oxalate/formate antiporter-like MFS transporter